MAMAATANVAMMNMRHPMPLKLELVDVLWLNGAMSRGSSLPLRAIILLSWILWDDIPYHALSSKNIVDKDDHPLIE